MQILTSSQHLHLPTLLYHQPQLNNVQQYCYVKCKWGRQFLYQYSFVPLKLFWTPQ